MDPFVIDTIIEKIDSSESRLDEQGKELAEISKRVSAITDSSETFNSVAELVKKLQDRMNTFSWPVKEMTVLSNRLAENSDLLEGSRKTKQAFFHTTGKSTLVVIGLLMGIIILVIGWVNSSSKLDLYRKHDIMWRYTRLTNHSANLEYLQSVEKLYLDHPAQFQAFVEQEELRHKQLEESGQNAVGLEGENKGHHGNRDTVNAQYRKKKKTASLRP
jgi:hypothetical protein